MRAQAIYIVITIIAMSFVFALIYAVTNDAVENYWWGYWNNNTGTSLNVDINDSTLIPVKTVWIGLPIIVLFSFLIYGYVNLQRGYP